MRDAERDQRALTARGTAIQNVSFYLLVALTTLAFLALVASFLSGTEMPDYLVLLATLGGLAVFGISGFVIGPIIAAFFLVVWEMFAQEHGEPVMADRERVPAEADEANAA